jgi:hypothetical protein
VDALVVSWLRSPSAVQSFRPDLPALLARAEAHGLAGVIHDAIEAHAIPIADELDDVMRRRRAARELDHAAHLGMLRRIDLVLQTAEVEAVALKGALLAERLFERPSARPTGDIDLLVKEAQVDAAARALETLGYVSASGAREDRFRADHHHLHLFHPHALPLELHFHAYRGFGQTLRSEPLITRRQASPIAAMKMVGVLAAEDELIYLAVHAAAHRFVRLGWLYDLKLLLSRMTSDEIARAAVRAREVRYSRVVAFTAGLLVDLLGVPKDVVRPLGQLGRARESLLRAVVRERDSAMSRSATRFLYSTALCDDAPAAGRYATSASLAYVRRRFGLEA